MEQNNAPSTVIYLDSHSTTPLHSSVFEAMRPAFLNSYGNPSQDLHRFNWEARALLDQARESIASGLGCGESEIIFTSGATESNHLAVLGSAQALRENDRIRILSIAIEHSSVLAPLKKLEEQGFVVELLPLHTDGRVNLSYLKETLEDPNKKPVGLISIGWANHEIGTIQDIESIGMLARANGAWFHTDAVQAFGKIEMNLSRLPIDLMTISAHKVHGPKGVGALFVRRKAPRVTLHPLLEGGTQERRMRAGTPNVPLIVGFAKAFELARLDLSDVSTRLARLRDRLFQKLKDQMGGITRNGSTEFALPHSLNISVDGIDGAALFSNLKTVAVSNASSCLNGVQDYSQVLTVLGLSKQLAKASIRFGLNRFTTEAEIDLAVSEIAKIVHQLRKLERGFDGSRLVGGAHDCID